MFKGLEGCLSVADKPVFLGNAVSDGGGLFKIAEDTKIVDGLYLAADLADGIKQLCDRLHDDINEGDLTYCAEVKALAFLAETVGTIVRASEYSLRPEGQR